MECLDELCTSLENSNLQNMATGGDNSKIEKIVEQIQNRCTYRGDTSKEATKKKVIGFLYKKSIVFFTNQQYGFEVSLV